MDTCRRKFFRLVCVSYNLLKSCRFVVGVDYGGGSVRVGYKRVSEAAKGRKVGDACNYPTHPNCNGPGASRQALILPTDAQSDWKMATIKKLAAQIYRSSGAWGRRRNADRGRLYFFLTCLRLYNVLPACFSSLRFFRRHI